MECMAKMEISTNVACRVQCDFCPQELHIKQYSSKNKLNNSKFTFFCTGILAQKYPDIIKQISNDGHEIACHYYHHDNLSNLTLRPP